MVEMKKLLLLILFVVSNQILLAQSMGINTLAPDPSAALDIKGGNQGLLVPRVGLQSLNDGQTIASPAHSLLVYNRNGDLPGGTGYYYNAGTSEVPDWKGIAFSSKNNTSNVAFRADGFVLGQVVNKLSSARVLFGSESYDLSNNYNDNSSTHGSTFTAPVKGIYHFDVSVFCQSLGGSYTILTLFKYKSGSPVIIAQDKVSGYNFKISTDTALEEGDQIYLVINNTFPGNEVDGPLYLNNKFGNSHFSGRLVIKQ